jgi:hypothetical protein
MSSLVSSFLNFSFDDGRLQHQQQTSKQISEPQPPAPTISVSSITTTPLVPPPTSYTNMTPKSLFKLFTRRHFLLNNGVKSVLDEFESTLTYLNVYRKNHLKQLISGINTGTTEISYEEAMQSKAKYELLLILNK